MVLTKYFVATRKHKKTITKQQLAVKKQLMIIAKHVMAVTKHVMDVTNHDCKTLLEGTKVNLLVNSF